MARGNFKGDVWTSYSQPSLHLRLISLAWGTWRPTRERIFSIFVSDLTLSTCYASTRPCTWGWSWAKVWRELPWLCKKYAPVSTSCRVSSILIHSMGKRTTVRLKRGMNENLILSIWCYDMLRLSTAGSQASTFSFASTRLERIPRCSSLF